MQAVEEEVVSEEKNKPIRDETLAKVLEAAYVMQERNRTLQKPKARQQPQPPQQSPKKDHPSAENRPASSPGVTPKADSTFALAQIVEIQHQVQVRHLELESVMSLVAERLTQIAGARSAAIGILEGKLENKRVRYRAAAGPIAPTADTEVPMEEALGIDCLRTGRVFRCADTSAEVLLDKDDCQRRGIQSMIAVPIFNEGEVAGCLEVYFPTPQAFNEEDVHTCQLMAGLVSEALARNEKVSWKKSLASERAVMLEALEKLRPNLAALADTPAIKDSAARVSAPPTAGSATFVCPKCRHEFVGQEQFCGNCGLARSSDYEAPNMQSTIAALWHMQEAMKKTPQAQHLNDPGLPKELQANLDRAPAGETAADSGADSTEGEEIEEPVPETDAEIYSAAEPYAKAKPRRDETTESTEPMEEPVSVDFENSARADLEIPLLTVPQDHDDVEIEETDVRAPEETALAKPEHTAAWSSAATARAFLQQLAAAKDPGVWTQFWNNRRGDVYLAIAVVLVLGVIRWGIWSGHSVSATGNPATSTAHHKAAPDADLSLFDRILVKLGLAEAPEPPEYKGNPHTQVWVDLHTALYYCPGADLYGKTPKGRFSSQRDAQLDQFEPAYRKACD